MKSLLFLVLFAFLLGSCYESGTIPQRVGSTLDSKINGTVVLYDDFLNEVSPEGMTVTIEGEGITAVTDTSGRFTFKDVPYGTLNFIYTKAGYGTFRLDTFRHEDNNDQIPSILPNRKLGAVSTTAITNLFVWYFDNNLSINPTVEPAGTSDTFRGVRFFFGNTADVTGDNYTASSEVFAIRKETGAISFSKTTLTEMGFAKGATVYVKAYGDAFLSNEYINMATGKRVFPNLNTNSFPAQSFVFE